MAFQHHFPRHAVLALCVALSGVACGGKPPPRGNQAPLVSVISPSLSEVPTTITFNGTINARDEMPISVEGEGGRIAAVLVEVGDTVKRGQVLAPKHSSRATAGRESRGRTRRGAYVGGAIDG
jgi:multidrug efflux pump subunit AcrA (membrane-fusion protein)